MIKRYTFTGSLAVIVMTASWLVGAPARAVTLELNCGQPPKQHLSVNVTNGTVFSQTKNDPAKYGPGSGYRGVWEPVTSYTAPAQITPTLISWVIYAGTVPFY